MSKTNHQKRLPKLARHRLHLELKQANPLMTLKQRVEVLDEMEILLFINWLGDTLERQ